ncbi:MAG: DegT/DnrJ/EryC1/StrS family aminotransferase [Bacteroidales bacterium]
MIVRMLDLRAQYEKIKRETDEAIQKVIDNTNFINGGEVGQFEANLASYLNANHVIGCANGTDALQIAMMALELKPGDEVIVPAFTYVATAEVIALLGLTPVLVDVNERTFNIKPSDFEKAITAKTKAVVPVHLFGQTADMETIMEIARRRGIKVIEDVAQALGAVHTSVNGSKTRAATIGDIGCTSFFPTKNLGCFGDGGAIITNNSELAAKLKMVANHGQKRKYHHDIIGCNSRLDTIQAAILDIKLRHLNEYERARYAAAKRYKEMLKDLEEIQLPLESSFSTHVYHQFTLIVKNGRDELKNFLESRGISSMVYYPLPLHHQKAFADICKTPVPLTNSEYLCEHVLSLPIDTEIGEEAQRYVADNIIEFFTKR